MECNYDLRKRGDSENHIEDQLFHVVQWSNITLFLLKTCRDCISSARKSYQVFSLAMYCTRVESGKGDILVADNEELEKMDASEVRAERKTQCKGSVNAHEWWKNCIPSRRWNSQTLWRTSGSENIHFNLGSPRPRRRTRKSSRWIRRVFFNPSSRLIAVWWWSKKWFLVQIRELYLPSSRSTQSQPARAERSVILNSTEIYRRDQDYECIAGCTVGERIDEGSRYWMRNHRMDFHGRVETDKKANDIQTRLSVGKMCQRRRSEEKNKSGLSKNRSQTMLENCVVFTSLTQQMKNSRRCAESWKFRCRQQRVAEPDAKSTGKRVAFWMVVRQDTHASLMPTNLKESVWKELFIKVMKIILQEENLIHWALTILCTNSFLCLKPWKFQMQKAAVDQEWENLKNISTAADQSQKQFQKYEGRVVLRGDIVKDDAGSYAEFTEQGSSASQMTAAKVMDITSRLPGCAGQAADAISAYTEVKMEDAPKFFF